VDCNWVSDMFQSLGVAPCTSIVPLADRIDELADRSDGFLSDVSTLDTGLPGAAALVAQYNHLRFERRLFANLGIDCPEGLADATAKRSSEYLAGRAMAQLGQAIFGHQPSPVRRSETGAPAWPHGLAGSISHSAERCFCLMLPDCSQLVGADTERLAGSNQLRAILRIVATPSDRTLITGVQDPAVLATLLFSAKEALFKLLFPLVQRHFGFACAELCALPTEAALHLRLTQDLHPALLAGAVFRIGYVLDDSHVTTWATARPSIGLT
jgi:enterobactin synthetase component D